MRQVSTHATGMNRRLSIYTHVDARIDHPHTPTRELGDIVRAALSEPEVPVTVRAKLAAIGRPMRTLRGRIN